jgi:hypothetical protein
MFQPAYEQYLHTDEDQSCAARMQAVKKTPEASILTKCEEDAQIRTTYVTTCEKSVGVVKCGYSDMLLFQDDICVFQ